MKGFLLIKAHSENLILTSLQQIEWSMIVVAIFLLIQSKNGVLV